MEKVIEPRLFTSGDLQKKGILVKPRFNLREYKAMIDFEIKPTQFQAMVKQMESAQMYTSEGAFDEEVPVIVVPRPAGLTQETSDRNLYHSFQKTGIRVLSLPYLLGLIADYPTQLYACMQQFHSIETLEFPPYGCYATYLTGTAQLALRRKGDSFSFFRSDLSHTGRVPKGNGYRFIGTKIPT